MDDAMQKVTTDLLIDCIRKVVYDKLKQSNLCSDDILELMEVIKLLKEMNK